VGGYSYSPPIYKYQAKLMNQDPQKSEATNLDRAAKDLEPKKFFTKLLITLCFLVIVYTLWKINLAAISSLGFDFLKPLMPFLKTIANLLKYLTLSASKTLWIPISAYILLRLFFKSFSLRLLVSVTILCLIVLYAFSNTNVASIASIIPIRFNSASSRQFVSLDTSSLRLLVDLYFFVLLLTPRVFWKFSSSVLLIVVSAVLVLVPNLPFVGEIWDLTILSSAFAYLFLFVHSLASGTQAIAIFLANISDRSGKPA
jgi:hypothetical protein